MEDALRQRIQETQQKTAQHLSLKLSDSEQATEKKFQHKIQ